MSDIEIRPKQDFQMLKFKEWAGTGIQNEGGKVSIAFETDGPSIDVTMTEGEARQLLGKLKSVLK